MASYGGTPKSSWRLCGTALALGVKRERLLPLCFTTFSGDSLASCFPVWPLGSSKPGCPWVASRQCTFTMMDSPIREMIRVLSEGIHSINCRTDSSFSPSNSGGRVPLKREMHVVEQMEPQESAKESPSFVRHSIDDCGTQTAAVMSSFRRQTCPFRKGSLSSL